jgi:nucleotidyltransferase substrate binding protein (TIGR01987 family)
MSDADSSHGMTAAFETALGRLEDALRQPLSEWTRDASIQRFELTFELAWKTAARQAHREGIECASPRQTWKALLRLAWIQDEHLWLDMLNDRNQTSHTYNQEVAQRIYGRLGDYAAALRGLLIRLRAN